METQAQCIMDRNSATVALQSEHSNAPGRMARLIAFYLPQFHPIPENDSWWGKGFTEWTNVTKAQPLFRGHYQPRLPADLGFYDLRVPEVREAQAKLARSAGIEGFCYWHYWFSGKRILERPFNEVLRLKEPDFPFCLGWANHSWTGIWHGAPNKTLIAQTYGGRADYEAHFHEVLEAFHDRRYIRVDGNPVFVIFKPTALPATREFIALWQSLAARNGLPGIHFIAHVGYRDQPYDYKSNGFSGMIAYDSLAVSFLNTWQRAHKIYDKLNCEEGGMQLRSMKPYTWAKTICLIGQNSLKARLQMPNVVEYEEAMLYSLQHAKAEAGCYPCVLPNWDHSPRAGKKALIFHNSTPELFRQHLRKALSLVTGRSADDRLVFVKSWNEWAEGNYLEPDMRFGHAYLNVIREEVMPSARQAMTGSN
jgi:hypothetical protein